jgi:chromosomal replication initiation ATPase DnaA
VSTPLNPRYRFESYVVGAANRLAATAARAVAESPGAAYNPLFVYAGSGLGKTHLLMAIGHAATEINPQVSVEYLTLDDFVEAFHAAIAAGQGEAYRRRYAEVGVLLVDDVQFLTHRREMQAELLRLTNTMLASGRQIVLSSDRPPNEIEALDERLIQRFAGGLVIDIAAPDFETRVAILRRQAEERKAQVDASVIETVAGLAMNSVRELIGALNRLIAFQAVSDRPLDAAQARAVLGRAGAVRLVETEPRVSGGVAVPVPQLADALPEAGTRVARLDDVESAVLEPGDEFGSFLSEIQSAVARQVEPWRVRVNEGLLFWEGEGYKVERLRQLLAQAAPENPDAVLERFVADIERLKLLQSEMQELDPAAAGTALFRDPERLQEALLEADRARQGASPPPGPLPLWRLETFVESTGNRVAVRAAKAVVERPGLEYNPLVITGVSGVGKTHLLHAIGNGLAGQDDAVVACLSTQDFVDDLIKAIDRDRVNWWRARYRRISALLLDDIHLLAGKDRSQEELFWLFNLLEEAGRQMIFTSALPLTDIHGLEPRLRTRLEGGLVVELPPPDREVRTAIVARLLAERKLKPDDELAHYIAGRPIDSARSLPEMLQRVLAEADARQTKLSVAIARDVLEGNPAAPLRRSVGQRTSGVLSPTAGLRSREKMVWDWPSVTDRVIEDLR